MVKVPYSKIEPTLKTGDIVLFHGLSFISKLVEDLENSEFSHTGMVVFVPNQVKPLFWQSTIDVSLEDEELKIHKTGPQLELLEERFKTYDSNIYAIRHLKVQRTDKMINNLYSFIKKVHHLPFPSESGMIWENIEGLLGIRSKNESYFCSQLLTATFQSMGLLSEDLIPNKYSPKDYSDQKHMPFLLGATLEEEIFVDINS